MSVEIDPATGEGHSRSFARPVVTQAELEGLQKDCGIPNLPTQLTYQLRMAVSGHEADTFLSWGYQWKDKPHRLVYAACGEIEELAAHTLRVVEAVREACAAEVQSLIAAMSNTNDTISDAVGAQSTFVLNSIRALDIGRIIEETERG
jgi:hypothetical protein